VKIALRLPFVFSFALLLLVASLSHPPTKVAAGNSAHDPTWWDKYQFILNGGADAAPVSTSSIAVGSNVDVSNECGPQSETFITINPNQPGVLAGGSNGFFLAAAEVFQPTSLTLPGLVSISVSPANTSVGLSGNGPRFVATGVFSDTSTQALQSVTWSSSNPAV